MSDTPQVINTLRTKADELEGYIAKLERDLVNARNDLSHIRATMVLFEAPQHNGQAAYMNINALFRRRELSTMCKEALATGPRNTRDLAAWVIAQKGLDAEDRHLRTAIAYRIVQALRLQEKRGGQIQRVEKRSNVILWSLIPA